MTRALATLAAAALASTSALAYNEPGTGSTGGVNGDITGMTALGNITPPSTSNYKLTVVGGLLINSNDSYVETPTNTRPHQGFRVNYAGTQNWDTSTLGTVSFNTISATYNGNAGSAAGKGIEAFNVSFAPLAGYQGAEFYGMGVGIVTSDPLNTSSDFVAITAGTTINNVTGPAHIYALFGTNNIGSLANLPIIHAAHVEQGITSGAIVQYENGYSALANGSSPVKGNAVNAGSFATGAQYTITTIGSTDFTLVGATSNTVGGVFIATGPGTGTGVATQYPWSSAYSVSAAGVGGVQQAYQAALSFEDVIPHTGAALPQALATNGVIVGYDNQTPCVQTGPIQSGVINNAGSAYTTGTYTAVPVTGGVGTGATATVTTAGGVVTAFTIVARGAGYAPGDLLSVSAASVGGAGSGFAWLVMQTNPPGPIAAGGVSNAGSGYTNGFYTLVPMQGGSGTGAYSNINVVGGSISNNIILGLNRGSGYVANDVLTVNASDVGGTGSGFTWTVAKTNPSCPMSIAHDTYLPNVYFAGDVVNMTGGRWRIDTAFKESIRSISLSELSPAQPSSVDDVLLTALTTRSAPHAIPAASIPASTCATGAGVSGCWEVLFGVVNGAGQVLGTPGYIPYYTTAPDGTLTSSGTAKVVATGQVNIGGDMTAVGTANCPSGSIGGIAIKQCRNVYSGATLYYQPLF